MPTHPMQSSQFISIPPSKVGKPSKFLSMSPSIQTKPASKPPVKPRTLETPPLKVTPTMVLESVKLLHANIEALQKQLGTLSSELVHVSKQQEALTQLVDAIVPRKQIKAVPENTQDGMLDIREVAKVLGLSKSTIYAMRKSGEFPEPKSISKRCVRWTRQDVTAWQKRLKDANQKVGNCLGDEQSTPTSGQTEVNKI